MIVTVPVVPVVEPSLHDVVVMVPVGNPGMAAVLGMLVVVQLLGTALRIGFRHGNRMLVDMAAVNMVQVTVVKIIRVRSVTDGEMPAIGRVTVGVLPVRAVPRAIASGQHAHASQDQQGRRDRS